MRVKLCSRCPYAPRDLADHYDPDAALYSCARCDSELEVLNPSGACEARRRRTMLNRSRHHQHDHAKRCAVCVGKFGLIRHYSWRTAVCSKKCLDRFKARRASDTEWLCRFRAA